MNFFVKETLQLILLLLAFVHLVQADDNITSMGVEHPEDELPKPTKSIFISVQKAPVTTEFDNSPILNYYQNGLKSSKNAKIEECSIK